MKVEVLFKSHRFEEFDTSPQTASEPFRSKGTAVLMDWNLYLGDLNGSGVVLAQHWYDGSGSADGSVNLDGVNVPAAVRKVGCAMLLVSPDELSDIVWLKKTVRRSCGARAMTSSMVSDSSQWSSFATLMRSQSR